jgi:hypothetical protein
MADTVPLVGTCWFCDCSCAAVIPVRINAVVMSAINIPIFDFVSV